MYGLYLRPASPACLLQAVLHISALHRPAVEQTCVPAHAQGLPAMALPGSLPPQGLTSGTLAVHMMDPGQVMGSLGGALQDSVGLGGGGGGLGLAGLHAASSSLPAMAVTLQALPGGGQVLQSHGAPPIKQVLAPATHQPAAPMQLGGCCLQRPEPPRQRRRPPAPVWAARVSLRSQSSPSIWSAGSRLPHTATAMLCARADDAPLRLRVCRRLSG